MAEARSATIIEPWWPPCRVGDPPPYQPWTQPTPWIDPYPAKPFVYPTIPATTTPFGDLLGIKKREARIKELEALLQMAHDELLCGDDDDALAVCELIEEQLADRGGSP